MEKRTRVELPSHVVQPLEVYVNGVLQRPGADYEQVGRTLVFGRVLATEGRLGFWRWASMLFGVAGTYRRHDSVDVVYAAASGRRDVETGLPFEAISS